MSERKTIEYDLSGAAISQHLMDQIWAQMVECSRKGEQFDIVIRRPAAISPPRLVVDYGDLYEVLIEAVRKSQQHG